MLSCEVAHAHNANAESHAKCNWCFEPSQPLEFISGLKETFIKRYIVERTNKAENDQKNRVRKWRIVRIYGMKYS